MERGYIKLWRKIQDSKIWTAEKFTKGQAWIDLIMLANHKPTTIWIRGIPLNLDRGTLAWSEVSLARRWRWSREKVRNYLKFLSETEHQIRQQKTNVTTLIHIINYDDYQGDHTANHTANQTAKKHQKNTKKTPESSKSLFGAELEAPKNVKNVKKYIGDDFKFKKAVPLPKNIFITDKMKAYYKKQNGNSNNHLEDIFEGFCINARKKGVKWQDWTAAFYSWIRLDKQKYHPEKYKPIIDPQKEYEENLKWLEKKNKEKSE